MSTDERLELTVTDHELTPEYFVLWVLLNQRSGLLEISDVLHPRDFSSTEARLVYESILRLGKQPEKGVRSGFDAWEIAQDLKAEGAPDIGDFIEKIFNYGISTKNKRTRSGAQHRYNISPQIERIKEAAQRREVKGVCDYYSKMSNSPDKPVKRLIESAISDLTQVNLRSVDPVAYVGNDTLPSVRQLVKEAKDGKPVVGVGTGLPELDRKLVGGFMPGCLYIVAGRPAMGKSSLAGHFALSGCDEGKAVLFISMEMSKQDLCLRMLASLSGVSTDKMRSGRMDARDVDRFTEATVKLQPARLMFDETPTQTVASIRSRVRRCLHQEDLGLDMVIVDYLQLISPDRHRKGRVDEVRQISRDLKALAIEFKIPVLALSQLNRNAEMRNDHRPMLGDLRASGSIEQDADAVILIYRDEYYRPEGPDVGLAELNIAKNRGGESGMVKVGCDIGTGRFKTREFVRGRDLNLI